MLKKILIAISYVAMITYVHAQESVNIGIYQNEPKIFMDSKNKPSGFFIDILDEIALRESWKLNYIPCVWSECLNMLEDGKIDIMPDVAYSVEREQKFLFSKEAVISSWSVLYGHKKAKIDSIFSLQDKRIAVLKGSIQSSAIKKLLNSFNIKPAAYKEVSDFKEAFELLAHHEVDCVITNRFYELNHNLGTDTVRTNILIEPSMLKYAFAPFRSDLADAVDYHLKEFKKNQESVFYQAEEKWITPKVSTEVPIWLVWASIGSIFVILILVLLVIIFRKMVIKKSEELLQKEEIMLMQSRQASMGEMINMIAHQWRQPLSVISMDANNIRASIELQEEIRHQELKKSMQNISDQVQYLSNTIDDFRNFFKPNKTKIKTHISHVINNLEKIISKSLQDNNIELIIKYKTDYSLNTYPNELLQVLLNIINNAKDILIDQKVANSKITVITLETEDSYSIEICDNGGGIPKDLMSKIGEQYFTTKADKGTGLGLYMSITIIKKHLNGSLTWNNRDDGACFTISLFK